MLKKTIRRLVLPLIVLAIGVPSTLQGEIPPKDKTGQEKFSSLQKSLIIPGWGQFVEKRHFEGSFFLVSEICYIYEVFLNNRRGNSYYQLYKTAVSTEDAVRYRDLTERYDKKRNIYMLVAVGVWAVNLVDTYIIVKKRGREAGKLEIKANVSYDKGLLINYRVSF
jgi:hypothetical protein